MKEYLANIEEETINNTDYRRVLYTGRYMQLVVMNIRPGEEIGNEIHGLDQFIRSEAGTGKVILNNKDEYELPADHVVIIPAGTWHNVVNEGSEDLKLYTIYSTPEHKDGVVQPTKADEKEEHFDGVTTADRE
ncbi:MAG: cupin domain-containing protein [Candidatus Paceibacterota bacterium]